MKHVLMPCGLSVIHGLRKAGVTLEPGYETAQVTRQRVTQLGEQATTVSAELSTLKAMKVGDRDGVSLLSTDTEDGRTAAALNVRLIELVLGLKAQAHNVDDLVLENPQRFRTHGVSKLVDALNHLTDKAQGKGADVWVSISGGVKPMVPYVVLYALLRYLPITYMFEHTNVLLTLPPLPIDFNWADLEEANDVFEEMAEAVTLPRERVSKLLKQKLGRLEGLFEEADDGQLMPSAFGMMIVEAISHAQSVPVMLSPGAQKKLDSMQGPERKAMVGLLYHARNPLWRASKTETFEGSDLLVYKPGNTAPRLAGWESDELVYVAELYSSHDKYEQELKGHNRRDYAAADFTPFAVPKDKPKEEFDTSVLNHALDELEQVKAENERLKDELQTAIALAEAQDRESGSRTAALTDQLNQLREENAQLQQAKQAREEKHAAELKIHLQRLAAEGVERDAWGLWRRLMWALRGR